VAIAITEDRRERLGVFVERLLFAYKNDGVTAEKASADLLAVIEAAAGEDWDEIEARLARAAADGWDD
jgi:hypothetical protein